MKQLHLMKQLLKCLLCSLGRELSLALCVLLGRARGEEFEYWVCYTVTPQRLLSGFISWGFIVFGYKVMSTVAICKVLR